MSEYIERLEKIPVAGQYDVIVAGAGVAGVAAALSARRAGKSVLLIEKSLMLGGLATLGHINLFVPMCNGRGKQIILGMAEELLRMSIKYGYDTIPEEWKNGEPGAGATTRYITQFSANIFALTMLMQIIDEGIELLLDSVISAPVMNGGHCDGLIVENKTGRSFYKAGVVVDTTGDADILYRAGVPTVQGKNFFTHGVLATDLEHMKTAVASQKINDAFFDVNGGNANLFGGNQMEGVKLYEGTTAEEVTEYIVENMKIVMEKLKPQERFSREVVSMPGMPQFRTTRRLQGDYVMTEEDRYRHFDDSISAICDFTYRDYLYEIPLRSLTKRGFDNLITAGRSASASGYAWDVVRVIPPAIVTGQAAGIAAAHALDEGKAIYDVDIASLQKALSDANVMIHFDDSLVPVDVKNAEIAEAEGHI